MTPAQGRLLHLLARMHGASSILELGTLGGYSAIWLARALPADGRLITLELNAEYAGVAAANIERAGLAGLIKIEVGPALEGLRRSSSPKTPVPSTWCSSTPTSSARPSTSSSALELTRPGSVIVTDNVVRDGRLVDPDSTDPGVQGMRRFHELLARERVGGHRVTATTIQTVGAKGYDGFTLALVER